MVILKDHGLEDQGKNQKLRNTRMALLLSAGLATFCVGLYDKGYHNGLSKGLKKGLEDGQKVGQIEMKGVIESHLDRVIRSIDPENFKLEYSALDSRMDYWVEYGRLLRLELNTLKSAEVQYLIDQDRIARAFDLKKRAEWEKKHPQIKRYQP